MRILSRPSFLAGLAAALAGCGNERPRPPEREVRTVAVVGDSLALGVGAGKPSDGFVYQAVVSAFGVDGAVVMSAAMSGALLRDIVRLQVSRITPGADAVVVAAGWDDLLSATPPETYADDYAELLHGLDRSRSGAVFCCGVPRVSVRGRDLMTAAAYYNDAIMVLARNHRARYVDLGTFPSGPRDGYLIAADGSHPSSAGYARLVAPLASALVDVERVHRRPAAGGVARKR